MSCTTGEIGAHEWERILVNHEYSLFDKHTKRQTSESCMKLQNGSKYYNHKKFQLASEQECIDHEYSLFYKHTTQQTFDASNYNLRAQNISVTQKGLVST